MSEPESINELNADLFREEEVDRFADPKVIRKKAMDYLARREHGFAELLAKMTSAGYDEPIVSTELARLRDEGLQDDQRFVEMFVQSRLGQGKGPVRIRVELGDKGVNSGLIENALNEADADWDALARDIRRRKFGCDLPADFKEKARQMRFLQYRGFEQSHIQAAMRADGAD